jgi:hypothetical protein
MIFMSRFNVVAKIFPYSLNTKHTILKRGHESINLVFLEILRDQGLNHE